MSLSLRHSLRRILFLLVALCLGIQAARAHTPVALLDGKLTFEMQDGFVPDEGRAKIQARLREAGRNFTWHEFNAAHAFLRDEGPRYDPALALVSYRLILDLFARA